MCVDGTHLRNHATETGLETVICRASMDHGGGGFGFGHFICRELIPASVTIICGIGIGFHLL